MKIRINSLIAKNLKLSRRRAERLIKEGKVWINGEKLIELGKTVDLDNEKVVVNGKEMVKVESFEYWKANKPKGYECSDNPRVNKKASTLVPSQKKLQTAGRLDVNSEGLIVLTNDGELTYVLTHPKFEIPKIYMVEFIGKEVVKKFKRLQQGVKLKEGVAVADEIELLDKNRIRLVIHQGWKRQIRRMMGKVGLEVVRLERISHGPVGLGDLAPGKAVRIEGEELTELLKLKGLKNPAI